MQGAGIDLLAATPAATAARSVGRFLGLMRAFLVSRMGMAGSGLHYGQSRGGHHSRCICATSRAAAGFRIIGNMRHIIERATVLT